MLHLTCRRTETSAWTRLLSTGWTEEQRAAAQQVWKEAQAAEEASFEAEEDSVDGGSVGVFSLGTRTALQGMLAYMRRQVRWSIEDLRDACCLAGVLPQEQRSLLGYFAALHHHYGCAAKGHLPQARARMLRSA